MGIKQRIGPRGRPQHNRHGIDAEVTPGQVRREVARLHDRIVSGGRVRLPASRGQIQQDSVQHKLCCAVSLMHHAAAQPLVAQTRLQRPGQSGRIPFHHQIKIRQRRKAVR